jgi:hypothetical protein
VTTLTENPDVVRAELAEANRTVNAAYEQLPRALRERLDIGAADHREAEIDAAIGAGDPERARATIGAWRRHWLAEFEGIAFA